MLAVSNLQICNPSQLGNGAQEISYLEAFQITDFFTLEVWGKILQDHFSFGIKRKIKSFKLEMLLVTLNKGWSSCFYIKSPFSCLSFIS